MFDHTYDNSGFKILSNTTNTVYNFREIIPLTNTVIASIAFPLNETYSGDSQIVGVTLTAGVKYPIYGAQIRLTSGSVILIKM